VKLEVGNSLYYEVYYSDDTGNDVILDTYKHTPTPLHASVDPIFSEIGSAAWNLCQPTFTYQQGAVKQNVHNPSTALRFIADKVRVRFIVDEVLTDAGNNPFVETYTDVIVPVPSVLSVFGITPGAAYTRDNKVDFYTQIWNLFEGEPAEGDLRLLPITWQLDNTTPAAITGTFGGTVDMANLSSGGHRLTVNFVYQAYTSGTWVDRETIVPYGINFKVTAPLPASRTLIDNATGITVSGNIGSDATLTVSDILLHAEGTCTACDAIRKAQKNGQLLLCYNISLSPAATGLLAISIPVGSQYNGQNVTILHCVNGKLETITVTVTNGSATFTATALSPFAVTTNMISPPNTGDAATPWGFIILGLAVLCACYKGMKRSKI
jgi:hypothetical protein